MLERERKKAPERERRKKLPYGPQFINISTKLKFAKLGIESEKFASQLVFFVFNFEAHFSVLQFNS